VVGTLATLGDVGARYLSQRGMPLEALARRELAICAPAECPLCRSGEPLTDSR
jgi:hypothetical protein